VDVVTDVIAIERTKEVNKSLQWNFPAFFLNKLSLISQNTIVRATIIA
jgi:hypothetical protein